MKRCRVCGLEKPLEDFHRNPTSLDGRAYKCKTCYSAYYREYLAGHREQKRTQIREWARSKRANPETEGTRTCPGCGQEQPLINFHRGSSKEGRAFYCRTCAYARGRVYIQAHRDHTAEYHHAWYGTHQDEMRDRERRRYWEKREHLLEHKRRRYQEDPTAYETMRNWTLKKLYGLSLYEYDAMLDAQGGVCWICQQPQKGNRPLEVDHNHTTGDVRALLCNGCNTGIGRFKERPDLLLAAIEYLSFFNGDKQEDTIEEAEA